MDDLISRQAAIDEAKEWIDAVYFEENDKRERKAIECFIGSLKNMPSAQPEQQWIPCSERLPEKNGRYLATRGLKACNSIWNRVYIINYSDLMGLKAEKIWWDGNVGKSDFQRIDDVVAWMPLPEPWKEKPNEIH